MVKGKVVGSVVVGAALLAAGSGALTGAAGAVTVPDSVTVGAGLGTGAYASQCHPITGGFRCVSVYVSRGADGANDVGSDGAASPSAEVANEYGIEITDCQIGS